MATAVPIGIFCSVKKKVYNAIVPKSPLKKSSLRFVPIHDTCCFFNSANPMTLAMAHLKNTSSIVGKYDNFFTMAFIRANQKVESNICLTPGVKILPFTGRSYGNHLIIEAGKIIFYKNATTHPA